MTTLQIQVKDKVLQHIKSDFKKQMEVLYGKRLAKVVLYGSYARGDFHEESDMDFMVVLKDSSIAPLKEISKINKLVYPISLEYDVLISTVPTTVEKYNAPHHPFYRNVRAEAIVL